MIKEVWKELKPLQKELDNHIFINNGVKQSEIIEKEIVALLVELGECANEWRGFKYWSTNQSSSDELLGEMVDVVHFTLSIENYYEFDKGLGYGAIEQSTVEGQFKELFHIISGLNNNPRKTETNLSYIRGHVIGLIAMLGFTPDQIEQAYYEKNKENFNRQENGY